jgi:hypothetical protein
MLTLEEIIEYVEKNIEKLPDNKYVIINNDDDNKEEERIKYRDNFLKDLFECETSLINPPDGLNNDRSFFYFILKGCMVDKFNKNNFNENRMVNSLIEYLKIKIRNGDIDSFSYSQKMKWTYKSLFQDLNYSRPTSILNRFIMDILDINIIIIEEENFLLSFFDQCFNPYRFNIFIFKNKEGSYFLLKGKNNYFTINDKIIKKIKKNPDMLNPINVDYTKKYVEKINVIE